MQDNNANPTFRKVAVITGGTRGIGKAIAWELAAKDRQVVILGTNANLGVQVAKELTESRGPCEFRQLDVSNEAQVNTVFEGIVETHGGIHILINNAAVSKDFLLMRSKTEDWLPMIHINYLGALYCTRAAVRSMVKARWGRIIYTSSIVGLQGNAGQSIYCSTKAALIGLAKSLAKELAGRNITVNAIAPGFIETDMTNALPNDLKAEYAKKIPLGRLGQPADIAHAISYLVSEGAGYVTGQVLSIDGGGL